MNRLLPWSLLVLFIGLLSACHVPHQMVRADGQPRESTRLFFYPAKGQTQAQQDRDQYDCYLWAMKNSGFDPSIPQLAPHQRYTIQPYDPNHDTASGMATGAVIGSIVAPPRRSAEGAVVGAVIGAIVGSASDAERNKQMARHEEEVAEMDQKAEQYKRAMTACLEGRGYTVK